MDGWMDRQINEYINKTWSIDRKINVLCQAGKTES